MMEDKDREVMAGENMVYLSEENILQIIVIGDTDEKKALKRQQAAFRFFNSVEGKVNALIDLNRAGKQSSKARRIGKETFEHEKNGRIAIFGMHPVARVIGLFVMGVTNKKDMRFFKTQKEALEWLQEPEEGALKNDAIKSENVDNYLKH